MNGEMPTIGGPVRTVSSIPTTPYSGFVHVEQYPGSMLSWDEALGGSVGTLGILSDYSALPNLTAYGTTYICAQLVNPLSPTRVTEMCWRPATEDWGPCHGQILYGAYGELLNQTASGLGVGVWTEVWQSNVLPEWFWKVPTISLSAEGGTFDPSSVASEKLRLTVRNAASSGGNEGDALLSHYSNANSNGRGFSGARIRGRLSSGTIYGNFGAFGYDPTAAPSRAIGTYGSTTRLRLDAYPGAATNAIKLNAVELWAGG